MEKNNYITNRDRFLAVMEYRSVDRVPNHEAGVWVQTKNRWIAEGLNEVDFRWDWFTGEDVLGLDPREFIDVNYGMIPHFEYVVLESDGRHEIFRDTNGITRKALIEGTAGGMRSCMDEYVSFPVENRTDFVELKKRFTAGLGRHPVGWRELHLPRWKNRDHVLILGRNCSITGFYWRAREWMGTENLSYAFYDQPELVHEMMEFIADYIIEVSKPILLETDVDYVMVNEDMSMKNGPLMSPSHYREFIFPHMRKLSDFFKNHGVRYVMVDTDGNCEALLPLLMDAGVDGIWPLERVADMDPIRIRKEYGKDLRLWGAVDKMEVAKGPEAIERHLAQLVPLIEEGGFIPTIDHAISPDISWESFQYYMKRKKDLLCGKF